MFSFMLARTKFWIAGDFRHHHKKHYSGVIMATMASQITSLTIVYSTVYSGADQRKHQNSASLAFVWEIHWWPVNSPHKWPLPRKMFPFDDVIMGSLYFSICPRCECVSEWPPFDEPGRQLWVAHDICIHGSTCDWLGFIQLGTSLSHKH